MQLFELIFILGVVKNNFYFRFNLELNASNIKVKMRYYLPVLSLPRLIQFVIKFTSVLINTKDPSRSHTT